MLHEVYNIMVMKVKIQGDHMEKWFKIYHIQHKNQTDVDPLHFREHVIVPKNLENMNQFLTCKQIICIKKKKLK